MWFEAAGLAGDVPPHVRGGMPQALPLQLDEEGEYFEGPKVPQRRPVGPVACACRRPKVSEEEAD